MPRFILGTAVGAALVYFLDPAQGSRRRAVTRDRALAKIRRGSRHTTRAGETVVSQAYGVSQKLQHRKEEPKDVDDATLAHKVESEIFRDSEVPKGQIDVNAQNGVVVLRGQVESPELIEVLVTRTRQIQGVQDVENLLHLPGTEAPMHQ